MRNEDEVVGVIHIDEKGVLRWPDGERLPSCMDCGSQAFADWHVPDEIWRGYGNGVSHLCWSCFQLRLLRLG